MEFSGVIGIISDLWAISKNCLELVQTAKRIYHSREGLPEYIELESMINNLATCVGKIENSPISSSDGVLQPLCRRIISTTKQLLDKLQKRKYKGKLNCFRVCKEAFRELFKAYELDHLIEKIRDDFDTVQIRYMLIRSDQSDDALKENATRMNELEAAISGMLSKFGEEIQFSRDAQKEYIQQRFHNSASQVQAEGIETRRQLLILRRQMHERFDDFRPSESSNSLPRRSSQRYQGHSNARFGYRVAKNYRHGGSGSRMHFEFSPVICSKCGTYGHEPRTCYKEPLVCFNCNIFGHRAQYCRVKP